MKISLFFILANALKNKLKNAYIGLSKTKKAFEDLTNCLSFEKISDWEKKEEKALIARGEALNIYEVQLHKGIVIQASV
jgi:hypothetical protein